MAKVGMTVMFLNRQNHSASEKKKGNAKKVVCEGMAERWSRDPDVNRELTSSNVYLQPKGGTYMGTSGEELNAYWEQMADSYVVTDKNGKTRNLRSDAYIGFAGICKPGCDYINTMSREEQVKFFKTSAVWVMKAYKERGMVIDAFVMHFDEGSPHMHYYGHDPHYRVSKKINLPFYGKLNREYPAYMREHGYDVQDLIGYDVDATRNMSDDELTEYKQSWKKQKAERRHGESSARYKQRKNEERAEQLDERDQQQEQMQMELQRQQSAIASQKSILDAQRVKQNEREEKLDESEKSLKRAYNALQGQKEQLLQQQAELDDVLAKVREEYQYALDHNSKDRAYWENRQKNVQQFASSVGAAYDPAKAKASKKKDVPVCDFD